MMPRLSSWVALGLMSLGGVRAAFVDAELVGRAAHTPVTVLDPACTANVTIWNTTTSVLATTVESTHILDVFVNTTTTNTVAAYVTVYTTETLHFTEMETTTLHFTVNETATVSTTLTGSTTVTTTGTTDTTVTTTGVTGVTVTTTGTTDTTVTTTGTTDTTVTTTGTTGVTVTTTGTDSTTITTSTTTTTTMFSTTYEPCPKSCSISADTVNIFYWPSNRPYTYPSTYVDTEMDYTFTSPSVYLYIPTARGINTLGQPAGPATSSWILPLDLYEVSTIAGNGTGATSQLNLNDLGTNCPRTADPTAIVTMVDPHCDPVLAAPKQVSSWAYPCNACGRFGLFDPPYAVPTVTGSLVTPTTTVVPPPITITAAPTPAPTSAPPVGVLLVVYYSDGKPVATATITQTGIVGTVVSSVNVPAAATSSVEAAPTTAPAPTSSSPPPPPPPASPSTSAAQSESAPPPPPPSPSTSAAQSESSAQTSAAQTSAAPTSAAQSSSAPAAGQSSASTGSSSALGGGATSGTPAVISGTSTTSAPSTVQTAAAPRKAIYRVEWLLSSIAVAAFLL